MYPEPGPYDLRFRLGWIPVRVVPGFWLVNGAIGLGLTQAGGAAMFFVWVAAALASILIHELAHVMVGRQFGAHGEMVLTCFGGLAPGSADVFHRWQRVLVYLAGPASQLALAAILLAVLRQTDLKLITVGEYEEMPLIAEVAAVLIGINILWPLINLIPAPPLDGGMVMKELLGRSAARDPWEQDPNWWKGD